MGKRKKTTAACAKSATEMKPPGSVIGSRRTDRKDNKLMKYQKYLLQNDTRYKQEIDHMTQNKAKQNVAGSDPIPSFKPKLVKDYRHGQYSTNNEASNCNDKENNEQGKITGQTSGYKDIGSVSNSGSVKFSVMSYNILSDNLMKAHPELYVKCDKADLVWNTRWEGIKQQIRQHDWPDVICLQEVQFQSPDHCTDQIVPFLSHHGYSTVTKHKTGNKYDGCLTAFRKDKFELEESCPVEYYIDRISVLDRHNVGLILKLTPVGHGTDGTPLIVANTHLLYNPKRGDIRLCQIALLLAEIDRIQPTPDTPVILTGDLNSEPESPVVKLLTRGRFQYSGVKLGRKARRPAPHKLLPDSLGLSDTCQWQVTCQQRGNDVSFVTGTGAFQHNLNLASVWRDPRCVTTYQDGWITVDYILHSVCDKLQLTGARPLPTAGDMSARIPSKQCPSDHLPLIADFMLKS